MATREGSGVEGPSAGIVRSATTALAAPAVGPDGPVPRRRSTRLRWAAAVGALALAGGAVWAEATLRGNDTVLATADGSLAEAPSASAATEPLRLDVGMPATVVAGQAAGFRVTWSDGDGAFAGSHEDWGEGVGASSIKQGPCPAAADARSARDTFRVRHTWTEPGTYLVVIGVTTSTCASGAVETEQAARSFEVTVAAP